MVTNRKTVKIQTLQFNRKIIMRNSRVHFLCLFICHIDFYNKNNNG